MRSEAALRSVQPSVCNWVGCGSIDVESTCADVAAGWQEGEGHSRKRGQKPIKTEAAPPQTGSEWQKLQIKGISFHHVRLLHWRCASQLRMWEKPSAYGLQLTLWECAGATERCSIASMMLVCRNLIAAVQGVWRALCRHASSRLLGQAQACLPTLQRYPPAQPLGKYSSTVLHHGFIRCTWCSVCRSLCLYTADRRGSRRSGRSDTATRASALTFTTSHSPCPSGSRLRRSPRTTLSTSRARGSTSTASPTRTRSRRATSSSSTGRAAGRPRGRRCVLAVP